MHLPDQPLQVDLGLFQQGLPFPLAFLTQTTLSVDDTAAIVEALTLRFPSIRAPRSEELSCAASATPSRSIDSTWLCR